MSASSLRARRAAAARSLLAVVAGALALGACSEGGGIQQITAAAPPSRMKFFNFGVGTPGVNFYANDRKVTAISSTACTPLPAPPADSTCRRIGVENVNGVAQGAAGAGGFYVGFTPGQYNVSGRIAAATDNGLAIGTFPITLDAGKAYSFFLSGVYDATNKRSDGFVVEDVFNNNPSSDSTYIRFVNASHNAPAVALAFRNATTGALIPLSGPAAYKAATAFTPFAGGGVVDIVVVSPAAPSVPIVTRTGVTFIPGRVYTVGLRGDWTLSPTGTSANRPQLDNTANY